MFASSCSPPAVDAHGQLSIVARELEALTQPLCHMLLRANAMRAVVHWRSKAAEEFDRAVDEWATELFAALAMLEDAAAAARRERDYAAFLAWGCE
ncbi:hypothetical protein [Microbacterium sp. C7(2022)]|uniref:hypothetical protein n=1 Tax=Microbacterium sp. C7(2022) TaxID=2992759 RepID=UPI00237AB5ED|nr:hypothetical protein [Microbacterium sp. C7(2022)]MDE0546378.1 hypothetical protein [Microbacterium sp. C7(2022)]